MQDPREPRRTARWGWSAGVAVVAIALLVVAFLGVRSDDQPEQEPTQMSPSQVSAPPSPTQLSPRQASASPKRAPTPPSPKLLTVPLAPVSVADAVPLTLPQELRAAHGSMYLEAGHTYVAGVDVSTVKPEDEPGLGMYLGITFTCSGDDTDASDWIGGTENLLPGEPVTFTNQMLLRPDRDQVVSCSVRANAPYDDVAAAGATIDLDIRWRVTEVDGAALSTPAPARLPRTVDAGAREVALLETFPAERLPSRRVELLAGLHLTTCTVVNGSREAGRTWCEEEDLDERGSDYDLELSLDVLDAHGEVCGRIGLEEATETLSLEKHHQLTSLEQAFRVPQSLCGPTLRSAVVVDNRGPASLVIHENNSSLITVMPTRSG